MGIYRDLEKRRAYMREYQRRKYAEDAAFREKAKAEARKRGREKYQNDPEHRAKCIEKVAKRAKLHVERIREYQKAYKRLNADRLRELAAQRSRERYELDPVYRERKKQESRDFNATLEARLYRKRYRAARRSNDPQFRIMETLRARINFAFDGKKAGRAATKYLGCTVEELMAHLERQFQPGMTWKNRGTFGWHIDHIKPCASFDLIDEKQCLECFNWRNLRPMWRLDNQSKGCKIGEVPLPPEFPINHASEADADMAMEDLAVLDASSLWKFGPWMARSDAPNKLPMYVNLSRVGAKGSDKFHWVTRMSCESLNSPSAARSWFDPSIRKTVENSALFELSPRLALGLRKYIPQQFRPSAALAVYEAFGGGKVYDPCGGWGDRLAAAVACPKVTHYHCRDVNPQVHLGYKQQVDRYDLTKKVSFELVQAETGGMKGYDADLVFTSPPYYKMEKYQGALQSYLLYPKFDQWLNGFLFRMVKASWEALKEGGHMVLNIADCYADHQMNRICAPLVKWATENLENCVFVGSVGYRIAIRLNKTQEHGKAVGEPMLVFSKGKSDWYDRMTGI